MKNIFFEYINKIISEEILNEDIQYIIHADGSIDRSQDLQGSIKSTTPLKSVDSIEKLYAQIVTFNRVDKNGFKLNGSQIENQTQFENAIKKTLGLQDLKFSDMNNTLFIITAKPKNSELAKNLLNNVIDKISDHLKNNKNFFDASNKMKDAQLQKLINKLNKNIKPDFLFDGKGKKANNASVNKFIIDKLFSVKNPVNASKNLNILIGRIKAIYEHIGISKDNIDKLDGFVKLNIIDSLSSPLTEMRFVRNPVTGTLGTPKT